MKKFIFEQEQDLSDASLDQNIQVPEIGGDLGGGGGLGDIGGGAEGGGFGDIGSMEPQQPQSPSLAITTYSDIGKIWVVKELNKIISNLMELNLILLNVSPKFIRFYEDLLQVQELMSIVLFNYHRYKDRFDVILATVKLFLVEYFKEMLSEIEGKVKDEEMKKTVKLLILRLEAKFYKKVKKETKELKEKQEKQTQSKDISKDMENLENIEIPTEGEVDKKETEGKNNKEKSKEVPKEETKESGKNKSQKKQEEEGFFNF